MSKKKEAVRDGKVLHFPEQVVQHPNHPVQLQRLCRALGCALLIRHVQELVRLFFC